nr:nucleoside deaminase [bacterium]
MKPEDIMRRALELARLAGQQGEVPVGAVVAQGQTILGEGYNTREQGGDPMGHAEIIALRRAARAKGSWRLADCTLYVTLEPCLMCAGAAYQARIARIIYAAPDPVAGALGGRVAPLEGLPRAPECFGGLACDQASQLMREFFKARRQDG